MAPEIPPMLNVRREPSRAGASGLCVRQSPILLAITLAAHTSACTTGRRAVTCPPLADRARRNTLERTPRPPHPQWRP